MVTSADTMAGSADLVGRTIAIVHPAWHSCGTYAVVLAQVVAYRRLGARVVTLACSDQPGFVSTRSRLRRHYVTMTPELDDTHRLFAGASFRSLIRPGFLKNTVWPYLHLDQAAIRTGMADASSIIGPPARDIALVHCNHFFCMPVARRLSASAPLIVETHDVQADQFTLLNQTRRLALRPLATRDAMLRRELEWLARADAIVHLNDAEQRLFASLMSQARHELIYPAIRQMPVAAGTGVLVVASGNPANAADIAWLLRDVVPLTPDLRLSIYGNVDRALASLEPALYRAHASMFRGRVDDLRPVYARAGVVLLPCRGGHGLSIKAMEALSSGARIVATTHAFRGLKLPSAALANVLVADDARTFGMRALQAQAASYAGPASPDARRAFSAMFGQDAYSARLHDLAASLLDRPANGRYGGNG